MLFNSLTFLVFFAVVWAVRAAPLGWTLKKAFLLVASWYFYAAAKWEYGLLLIGSTALNWALALAVARAATPRRASAWTALAVTLDVGLLAGFKYCRFLADNVVALARLVGVDLPTPTFDVPLPVGVSFFTFQALSYVVDVRRGDLKASRSFLDLALYIAYFPQLVAGPIVRASLFLPQLATEPKPTAAQIDRGATLFVFGMFLKVVLADALLAPVADAVFVQGRAPDLLSAWSGTLAYTGQIFCDFCGYSTAAIGLALMFGFVLEPNFRRPYGAVTFSDFWRRWHMSLSTWLRDYLYLPLGGNRKGRVRTYVNLMLVMLLGGLWHGAAWTFVAWGALHGVFLAVERACDAERAPAAAAAGILRRGVTLLGVLVGWVIFRSRDFASATGVLRGLVGAAPADAYRVDVDSAAVAVAVAGGLIAFHVLRPEPPSIEALDRGSRVVRVLALAGAFVAFVVLSVPDRAFIYFQF